jgi:triosephosphate isomerase (TIM)
VSNNIFYCLANWKMNGSIASLRAMIQGWSDDDSLLTNPSLRVVLFPPAIYIAAAKALIHRKGLDGKLFLGAQDLSSFPAGARTGEHSAEMLMEMGAEYVIVGHSERRQYHHESSVAVVEKAERALSCGLQPILCVGETAEQREKGQTKEVIEEQIAPLHHFSSLKGLMVAYEPLWAIGRGQSAAVEDIVPVLDLLEQSLAVKLPLLYGGSVKAETVSKIRHEKTKALSGFLIGNASLQYKSLSAIAKAVL